MERDSWRGLEGHLFILWIRKVRHGRFFACSWFHPVPSRAGSKNPDALLSYGRVASRQFELSFGKLFCSYTFKARIWSRIAPDELFSKCKVLFIVKKLAVPYLKHILFYSDLWVSVEKKKKSWFGSFQKPLMQEPSGSGERCWGQGQVGKLSESLWN